MSASWECITYRNSKPETLHPHKSITFICKPFYMDTNKGIFYFPPPQAFLNSNSPQNIQITIFVGRAARSAKALLLRVKNRGVDTSETRGRTICTETRILCVVLSLRAHMCAMFMIISTILRSSNGQNNMSLIGVLATDIPYEESSRSHTAEQYVRE